MIVRCLSCNDYFDLLIDPDKVDHKNWMFKCPNKHFSSFIIESALIVEAVEVPDPQFVTHKSDAAKIASEAFVVAEIEWLRKQTIELYDAGFLRESYRGDKEILPPLDLATILKPTEHNIVEDTNGRKFRLVLSPNRIPYYALMPKEDEDDRS